MRSPTRQAQGRRRSAMCSTPTGCATRTHAYRVQRRANGMVKNPLPAKTGERVRMFVLNVGPSKTSSPHRGHDLRPRGSKAIPTTTPRHADGAARIEQQRHRRIMIPEDGSYIMVTTISPTLAGRDRARSTAAAAKQELGTTTWKRAPRRLIPRPSRASSLSRASASRHSVGQGKKPARRGRVTKRRTDDWLTRWPRPRRRCSRPMPTRAMLKEHGNIPMPNQSLTDADPQPQVLPLDRRTAGRLAESGREH